MAIRRSRSFFYDSYRKRNSSLDSVNEEIGDGEDAIAPPASPMESPRLPRSCALANIASFFSDSMNVLTSPPSPSPQKTTTKLVVKDGQPDVQPPQVPAKLSKHDDRSVPKRKPPPPLQPPQPRSSSAPWPESTSNRLRKPDSPSRPQPRNDTNAYAEPQRRERSSSLAPPVLQNGGERAVSSPTTSRPRSSHSDEEGNRKLNKRKSWLGLSRSRNTSQDLASASPPSAWVELNGQRMEYNISFLTNGQKVRDSGFGGL
jgi:hypothetical protein